MKIILTFSFCFGRGQHRKRNVASVVVAQNEATDPLCTATTKKKAATSYSLPCRKTRPSFRSGSLKTFELRKPKFSVGHTSVWNSKLEIGKVMNIVLVASDR